MNPKHTIWPVEGYADALIRKRLAHFRPWLEDRRVCLIGAPDYAKTYVAAVAGEIVGQDDAEVVFEWEGSSLSEAKRWSQSDSWPFEIVPDPKGKIAIQADRAEEAPHHPRIGIAVPTHAHPRAAIEAAATMAAEYPGFVRFVIIANGVFADGLAFLRKTEKESKGRIEVVELDDNRGYGQGANAGFAILDQDETLDFIGVMNDDVLPGTDCLYELVHAFAELKELGHNPGAIGPVSNEINGGQRVEIGSFSDVGDLREKAHTYWDTHRSSAGQTLQLRGLCLLLSRECLNAVGGFDPRFGIGNFEDDDHNVRTRLAGFTLWIASGSFLFHHGSSTFRTLKVDYQANIRRNMESMLRKWEIEELDEWLSLTRIPEGVALYQPFEAEAEGGHRIKINGEEVDLIHQASDMEFAAWIMNQPMVRTPEGRKTLIETLQAA